VSSLLWLCGLGLVSLVLTSCGAKKQARVELPPPPPMAQASIPDSDSSTESSSSDAERSKKSRHRSQIQIPSVPPGTEPVITETGKASWYGAPYHSRRGSNGEIYDMNAMTAAHRTLPLGSVVRVTNVSTGHSAIVRITDRGPFVPGRIVDLSLAAAKKIDIWHAGIGEVRLELLQTPTPLDHGGRWAVQIGAFAAQNAARGVAARVSRRYHTAKVLCFSSPVGDWWVRVRVQDDDRERAEEVIRSTQTPQGSAFLVRLD
jgi:rare lipoprotein A